MYRCGYFIPSGKKSLMCTLYLQLFLTDSFENHLSFYVTVTRFGLDIFVIFELPSFPERFC